MHEEFSRSSTEAEYRDLASTATELIWLHYGFRDLDIHIKDPQLLNCYNMSATYLAANPVFHARTRDRFPLDFALRRGVKALTIDLKPHLLIVLVPHFSL